MGEWLKKRYSYLWKLFLLSHFGKMVNKQFHPCCLGLVPFSTRSWILEQFVIDNSKSGCLVDLKITWKQQKDSQVIGEVFVHCIVLLELNPLYWRWSTSVRSVRWGLASMKYKQTYLEICWSKPQTWYLLKEKQNSHTLDLIDSAKNSLLHHRLCFLQMSSNIVFHVCILCFVYSCLVWSFRFRQPPKHSIKHA